MHENIENIIAIKLTGGTLTSSEQLLFDNWMQDPEHIAHFSEYEKVWGISGKIKYQVNPDIDAEWESFKLLRDKKQPKKLSINRYWIVSTAVAASVTLAIGLFMLFSTPNNEILTYSTTNSRQQITLPDNSVVWLNENTQLSYCFNYKSEQREVTLNGEALFAVEKTGDPFIINTPRQIVTKVLGTEFNLKAYAADQVVQLAVISGKVSFGTENNNTIITKGQQVEFKCNANTLTDVLPVDENSIAWKTGVFVFNNEPLTSVAQMVGNYLNKSIELPENSDKLQYSGSFTEPTDESFAQIISIALSWDYAISDQKIVFKTK